HPNVREIGPNDTRSQVVTATTPSKEGRVGRRPWLDPAVIDAALKAVVEGATYQQAADRSGVSVPYIRKRFAAAGLVRRREPPQGKPPRIAEAIVRAALNSVARGTRVDDAAAAAGMG